MSDGVIDLSLRCFRPAGPAEAFGTGSGPIVWPRSPPTVYQRVPGKIVPLSVSCSNDWMMQQRLADENRGSTLGFGSSNGCLKKHLGHPNRDPDDGGLVVEPISPYSPPPSLGYVFFDAARHPSRTANVEDSMYPSYVRQTRRTSDDSHRELVDDSEWRTACEESMEVDGTRKRWPSDQPGIETTEPEPKRMLFCANVSNDPPKHYSDFDSSFDEYASTWRDRDGFDEHRAKAAAVDDVIASRQHPPTSGSNWKKNNRVPVVEKIVSDEEICGGEVDDASVKFDEYTRGLTAATADGSLELDADRRPLGVSRELRQQRLHEALSQKRQFHQPPMTTERCFEVAFPPTHWATHVRASSTMPHFDNAVEGYGHQLSPSLADAQLPPVSSFGRLRGVSSPFGHQRQDNHIRRANPSRYPSVEEARRRTESTSPTTTTTNINGTSSNFGLSTGSSDAEWPPDAATADGNRSGVLLDAEAMMKMMRKITGSKSEGRSNSVAVTTLDDVHLAAVADQIVSYVDRDDAYRERRRKNNEAAKRSRDYRRQKERSVAKRAEELKVENVELKAQIMVLSREVHNLQGLLIQQRMISTRMSGGDGSGAGSNHGNVGGLVDGNGGTSIGIMA